MTKTIILNILSFKNVYKKATILPDFVLNASEIVANTQSTLSKN